MKKSNFWHIVILAAAFLLIVAISLVVARAQAYPEPPPTVSLDRDVTFGSAGGQVLKMDIASPKGAGPFPAVICIHGGGWREGHKKDMLPCVFGLAQKGCVAVSVDYRLAPQYHFPAPLEDVKMAVRYLRRHATELKIDPRRIAAVGSSAGAHLALMLGTTSDVDFPPGADEPAGQFSSAVKAVASIAGPTDLTLPLPANSEHIAEEFMGLKRKENLNMFRRASPVQYIDASDAPILMIHGTSDQLVPYNQATTMLTACNKIGLKANLITIDGGGHGGGGNPNAWNDSILKMENFITEQLK